MKRKILNILLVPVIALTVTCSLANAGMNSPLVEHKGAAACPFHAQKELPEPLPAEQPSGVKCLSCLPNSALLQKSVDIAPDTALVAIVPVEVFAGLTPVDHGPLNINGAQSAAETPPVLLSPLRI